MPCLLVQNNQYLYCVVGQGPRCYNNKIDTNKEVIQDGIALREGFGEDRDQVAGDVGGVLEGSRRSKMREIKGDRGSTRIESLASAVTSI